MAIHNHMGSGPVVHEQQPIIEQEDNPILMPILPNELPQKPLIPQKPNETIRPKPINIITEDNELIIDKSAYGRNAVTVKSAKVGIAVVIFCYNRQAYLERTLESIFNQLPPAEFSVFISQQGYDAGVTSVIQKYADQGKAYWLGFDYDATDKKIQRGFEEERWKVYHKISAHYKYAFEYSKEYVQYINGEME